MWCIIFDELPEFSKASLEALRQPLEDKVVHISRINGSYTYPADFMLLAAMNPCPCGYYGTDGGKQCRCTPYQINRYINKFFVHLLDRIDIIVETTAIRYKDLTDNREAESSEEIRKRVEKAREIQLKDIKTQNICSIPS